MACRSIRPVVLAATLLVVAPAAGATSNVVLSRASGPTPLASSGCDRDPDTESEASIALDPRDPQHIVLAWMQDGNLGVVAAVTRDAGASWTRSVLPGEVSCTTPFDTVIDPHVAIGPDGIVYVATAPQGARASGFTPIYVHRSLDGGTTWELPAVVSYGIPQNVQAIAAFPDRPGRAVVGWALRYDAIAIATTDDGGATWSAPRIVRISEPGKSALFRMAALPGDQLVVTYDECNVGVIGGPILPGPCSGVKAMRSPDGGSSWSPPVEVIPAPTDPDRWPEVVATSSGVVYTVAREVAQSGAAPIWVSRSADGGATWAPPVVAAVEHAVDRSVSLNGGTLPGPGIGASEGHVVVLYEDGDGTTVTPRAVQSDGDAQSWSGSQLAEPFDVTTVRDLGEDQQVAVSGTGFAAAIVAGGPYALDGPTDVWVARGELER
jgi:hypothetical protein